VTTFYRLHPYVTDCCSAPVVVILETVRGGRKDAFCSGCLSMALPFGHVAPLPMIDAWPWAAVTAPDLTIPSTAAPVRAALAAQIRVELWLMAVRSVVAASRLLLT